MGYPSWRAARRHAHADAWYTGVPHVFYREGDSFTVKKFSEANNDGSIQHRPMNIMLPTGSMQFFSIGEAMILDKEIVQ